jgi:hypothetical protein
MRRNTPVGMTAVGFQVMSLSKHTGYLMFPPQV